MMLSYQVLSISIDSVNTAQTRSALVDNDWELIGSSISQEGCNRLGHLENRLRYKYGLWKCIPVVVSTVGVCGVPKPMYYGNSNWRIYKVITANVTTLPLEEVNWW